MFKKRVMLILAGCLMLTGLTGCQQQKDSGPDYADDEAMEIIAESVMARADLVDEYEKEGVDTTSMKSLQSYIDTERDHVDKLRTRVFEDTEMQESVLAYINTLDDADKVLENNPVNSAEFYKEWNSIYDKRSMLLKEFVDKYGMEVDEAHQEVLDEMIANGAAATKKSKIDDALAALVASVSFEKQNDGYGLITYSAIVENTTGVDFENVSMTLGCRRESEIRDCLRNRRSRDTHFNRLLRSRRLGCHYMTEKGGLHAALSPSVSAVWLSRMAKRSSLVVHNQSGINQERRAF